MKIKLLLLIVGLIVFSSSVCAYYNTTQISIISSYADEQYSATYAKEKAYDNNYGNSWLTADPPDTTDHFISVKLDQNRAIGYINFTGAMYTGYLFINMYVALSTDSTNGVDGTWNTIYTNTSMCNTAFCPTTIYNNTNLGNATWVKFYGVTCANPGCGLAEIDLYEYLPSSGIAPSITSINISGNDYYGDTISPYRTYGSPIPNILLTSDYYANAYWSMTNGSWNIFQLSTGFFTHRGYVDYENRFTTNISSLWVKVNSTDGEFTQELSIQSDITATAGNGTTLIDCISYVPDQCSVSFTDSCAVFSYLG